MQRFFSTLWVALGFLCVTTLLQACGSGSTTSLAPRHSAPLPLLVPGSMAQYSGAVTVAITFTSPTPQQPNSTSAYITAETDTVSVAPSSAPAPFDFHRAITFTVTTPPSYGTQFGTYTYDDYENATTAANGSQTLSLAQDVFSETGTSLTSILTSGGSGALTVNETATYTTPTTLAIYPLTTGNHWNGSLAQTVPETISIATSSGTQSTNTTTTYQADDSYTLSSTRPNGDTVSTTEMSNGSGSSTLTPPSGPATTTLTVGVPTIVGAAYIIPVSENGTSYSAADWYPGNALPPSPLGSTVFTVVGPASSLPTGCTYSGATPNLIEYDSAISAVNVLAGSVTAATTRAFDSNGLLICKIDASTTKTYSLTTGLLASTSVTNTTASLTSYTTASKLQAPHAL